MMHSMKGLFRPVEAHLLIEVVHKEMLSFVEVI